MNILVGYDGSNVAKSALQLAVKHATTFDAGLEVVSVMAQSHSLEYEEIQKAEQSFESEIRGLMPQGSPPYQSHLIVTSQEAGEALVEFAERHECKEIIIGVRRRSKVGKLVFGSTAQYVILHSPCPVISIK